MPRVGPVYTLPSGYEAVLGETIEPSQHNPPLEDIAQALTDSLPRNGTGPMTGALAMGSNKITGLAAGTNASDAVRFDQVASSAWLTSVSALALAADEMVYANGTNTAAKTGLSSFMRTVLDDANQAVALTTLGAQPIDATLTSLSGLSLVAGDILYATGADTLVRLPKGTDGQNLTLASGVPAWVSPTVSAWALASSGTLTGAAVTVTGLGGYESVMIFVDSATTGGAGGVKSIRVGGGAIETGNVYKTLSSISSAFPMTQATSAARNFGVTISRFNTTDTVKPCLYSGDSAIESPVLVATASALDRIQIRSASNDFSGGTYYIWGKP